MRAYNTLRETLPKPGNRLSGLTRLSGLMRRYGVDQENVRFGASRGPSREMAAPSVGTNRNALAGPEGNRGFSGGIVGTFDPQVVDTTQQSTAMDTPMGSVSMRDIAFGMMPSEQSMIGQGMLGAMQETFGPNAVTGMYGSPSFSQAQQAQPQMQQANALNANAGMFGNPAVSQMATTAAGQYSAPMNPGFMSQMQAAFEQENDDLFGQAMSEAASGNTGGYGAEASGDGLGGYGGPGGVGRGNERGGGIGF